MSILVDIDGTIADNSHRQHFVAGVEKDWPRFFAAMRDDQVIYPVANMVNNLFRTNSIILCTGRPAEYRVATISWLHRNLIPFTELYMRKSGDHRPDHLVKRELYDQILADGYNPKIVIDDRTSVVKMWRELGLVCLQNEDRIA